MFNICSIVYFLLDGCQYLYDSAAFLFSLVNKPGWQPLKLNQTGIDSTSISSCSDSGPMFGADMYISRGGSSGSFTNLGYDYSPPPGYSENSEFTKSFLAGSYYFQPDEVEVFYETT